MNGNNGSYNFRLGDEVEPDTVTVQEFAEGFARAVTQLIEQGDLDGITYLEHIATQARYEVERQIEQEAQRKLLAARLAR